MVPLIGVGGFSLLSQIDTASRFWQQNAPQYFGRAFNRGVLTSPEILHNVTSEWTGIFPKPTDISSLFSDAKHYNCIHYLDPERQSSVSDILAAIKYGGNNLDAVQLCMVWPDPSMIAEAKHSSRKPIEIILQIGEEALRAISLKPQDRLATPDELVEMIAEYGAVVERLLLDFSMGQGKEMDASILLPYVEAITEHFPQKGIMVAGGLEPGTLHLVEPILKVCPSVSIDTYRKMHVGNNPRLMLDMQKVTNYLAASFNFFTANRSQLELQF